MANFVTGLPSPVRQLPLTGSDGAELWLKDDSAIGQLYGGNKLRKLQLILPHAQAGGARRLVTVGAVGSHHVLATTVLAASIGLPVTALLFPQPRSEHALKNLKASLHAGLDARPVGSLKSVPFSLARLLKPGDYLIPAGGSGPVGSQGFYRAASELAGQVDEGALPAPDVVVVPLGSGGTTAGLLAGLVACGLKCLVCAVDVAIGNPASVVLVKGLANWLAARSHLEGARTSLADQLWIDRSYFGQGYGYDTVAGSRARETARSLGLELEVTYTSKAFAKALELGRFPGYDPEAWPRRQASDVFERLRAQLRVSGRPLRVLYWHTLSRIHPPAPDELEVPSSLMKQFLPR
ncbi:MAG TPA: pyridoxal-phosphate dependent enzyme [Polyangiaceae bacterium]